jgi:hypothetical protein
MQIDAFILQHKTFHALPEALTGRIPKLFLASRLVNYLL